MKKTVLFVSCSWMGYGADFSLMSIIEKLKEEGIDSIVYIPRHGRVEEYFKKKSIKYKVIPYKTWTSSKFIPIISNIYGLYKIFKNIILSKRISREIKNKKIIGIYSNTYTDCFGILLARRLGVSHIQHIREFGKEDFKRHYDIGEKLTNNIISKNSESIICISDCVLDKHKTKNNEDKIVKIYNGIPMKDMKSDYDSNKETCFVMVGRISELKRQKLLIDACVVLKEKGITGYTVHFIGDGDEKYIRKLKQYVVEKKLQDNIIFAGYQTDIDLSKYDIGIMCSPAEAFGRVTAEYMSCGLAVIGASGGATPEIISDGKTGLLFKIDDEKDLAEKMSTMIKNKALVKKYGISGYNKYLKVFSEKVYQNNIYNIISKTYHLS
ncbi:glycosyltransferase family 4 protein [Candidatus Saccharibacteria bacterium]|nr:glycosyltransferase family 4 protein [Candidatus Saccharibacteria bacterium]